MVFGGGGVVDSGRRGVILCAGWGDVLYRGRRDRDGFLVIDESVMRGGHGWECCVFASQASAVWCVTCLVR
jgi:hypothetical protein